MSVGACKLRIPGIESSLERIVATTPSHARRIRRNALHCALMLAGTAAAEAAPLPDAFEGARRVMLDPGLHDLHRRPAGEVARVAVELGLEAYLLPSQTRGALQVTNCNDNGAGSLRATIASAASGDVIDLRGLSCSTISLGSGQITVAQDSLSLIGRGPSQLEIRAGGGKYENRVFKHTGAGQFLVQGMTVSGGTVSGSTEYPGASGGCIRSEGTVGLGNALFVGLPELGAVVSGCRAVGLASRQGLASGGGVHAPRVVMANSKVTGCETEAYSDGVGPHMDGGGGIGTGSLAMIHSELGDNLESGSKYGGGGAAIFGGSDVASLVMNSTIAGNTARWVGGLSAGGEITVRNSTISGNVAEIGGGFGVSGLLGAALLDNVTITDNAASSDGSGGGIIALGQTQLTLRSSIVWGNFRSMAVADDIGSNVVRTFDGSNNLIGVSSIGQPGDTIINTDPHLRPLGWYGGVTRTHALRPSSQAIGRGSNPAGESWDQRGPGFPRVVGQFVDIGAFEYSDGIFTDGFD